MEGSSKVDGTLIRSLKVDLISEIDLYHYQLPKEECIFIQIKPNWILLGELFHLKLYNYIAYTNALPRNVSNYSLCINNLRYKDCELIT